MRDHYLYQVGSQFAQHFLNITAEGRLLEAYELMQPEANRQVAGTSLEEHYALIPAPQRAGLETFKSSAKTKQVVQRGPDAVWRLKRGVKVTDANNGSRRIIVRMVDTSQTPGMELEVTLSREANAGDSGTGSASWYVVELN
jgi:hypothetical protein